MTFPICVVMAVFEPKRVQLAEQLQSLAAQTYTNFHVVFVIADLESDTLVEEEALKHGIDFEVYIPSQRLDAVRAFEAGLSRGLASLNTLGEIGQSGLIALCDQDDVWHPTRLEIGVQALQRDGTDLVHSDARLIDAAGNLLHHSMFAHEGRVRQPGLRGLLYRNNITGMTVLMHRSLAEAALPFPPQSGVHFYHDLWLGLVAGARNGITLISEPLVDYRQHSTNVMGAIKKSGLLPRNLPKKIMTKQDASLLRKMAASYGLARYLAHSLDNRMADIQPEWHVHPTPKGLKPYFRRLRGSESFIWDSLILFARGKPSHARKAVEFAIASIGRTVWMLRDALSSGLKSAAERFDTRLFSLSPGCVPKPARHQLTTKHQASQQASTFFDSRTKPNWKPNFNAKIPAFSILVPTLNPTEVFAGIATAVDIGIGLAERGHKVKFIAMDLPISSTEVSTQFILNRCKIGSKIRDQISIHCGVQTDTISCHRDDVLMATAWWTAHAAKKLISDFSFSQEKFLYLIQDFEPNFYPWSSEYSGAKSSYDLNFVPIFNTSLLRDYFKKQSYEFAEKDALTFHPSIDLSIYSGPRPPKCGPRRLALYGRPEVSRNMFPTAIEALDIFIRETKLQPTDIELVSIGMSHPEVTFSEGVKMKSMGKIPWAEYPSFLLKVDVGLSLMYSPHPSHPPLEMAASGAIVVTNMFGTKNLGEIGAGFVSAKPTPQELAAALVKAWKMPEPTLPARQIDLQALGQPLDGVIEDLSKFMFHPTQFRELDRA